MAMNPAGIREKALQSPLFLLACMVGVGLFSARLHPLDSDEGVILNGAWNLLHARDLYQDSFEYIAPGSYYLVTWVWQFLGMASYEAARLACLAALAGGCLALFRTAGLLAGGRVTVLPALVYFVALLSGPVINHNALFVLPAAWALYFSVRSIKRDNFMDCLLSGLLCGFSILVLQHKGIVLAAALTTASAVAPLRQDKRKALERSLALGVAAMAPLGLLTAWDLQLVVDNLFLFPMEHYMAVQPGDPLHWLLVVLLWLWVQARVLGRQPGAALLPVAIAQATLLCTALQLPDAYHFMVIAFPAVALFPLFLSTYTFPSGPSFRLAVRFRNLASAGLSASLFFSACILFTVSSTRMRDASDFRLRLLSVVEKHCADSAYLHAGPFLPGMYFETGKLNVTRYSLLLERFNTDEQFLDASRDLQQALPPCVLIDTRLGRKFGHVGSNPMDTWIARNYRVVEQLGPVKIMRPASPP